MASLTLNGKQSLDALSKLISDSGKLPGFVMGATNAEGEIYASAGGKQLVGDVGSPDVDPDSVFSICSSTKFVAHIAALQLVDQGKLDVETPVKQILPQVGDPVLVKDLVSESPEVIRGANNILRIKDLLNFSSGSFYNFLEKPDAGYALDKAYSEGYDSDDKHAEFFDRLKGKLAGIPLSHEPGTDFMYGYNSDILGLVVEKISGTTLDAFMQKNIFEPLGMEASFYLTGNLKDKFLPITYRRPDNSVLEPYSIQPGVGILAQDPAKVLCLGGVGLYMSLRSYLILLRHILQILNGTATKPILKPATARSLFIPQLPEAGRKSLDTFCEALSAPGPMSWSNAMAINLTDWEGKRKAGSGMWLGWLGTNFWIDPATEIAGVMGVQLLTVTCGCFDPDLIEAYRKFEETLYGSLSVTQKL